jgi:hypothetical protein
MHSLYIFAFHLVSVFFILKAYCHHRLQLEFAEPTSLTGVEEGETAMARGKNREDIIGGYDGGRNNAMMGGAHDGSVSVFPMYGRKFPSHISVDRWVPLHSIKYF